TSSGRPDASRFPAVRDRARRRVRWKRGHWKGGGRMLLTNHVLSGALIGALTRRPLPAFAAGVASHFVLDAVPAWGSLDWRHLLRVAVADGLVSLAVAGAPAAAAPSPPRAARPAGPGRGGPPPPPQPGHALRC